MTRRASLTIGFLGLLLGLIAFLLADTSSPDRAEAVPLPPAVFFGSVSVGGQPAVDGAPIAAEIGGVNYAFAPTEPDSIPKASGGTYGQLSLFQVLADDPDTSTKEGGLTGETIVFYIGTSRDVAGVGTFTGGLATQLDLSIGAAVLDSIRVTPSIAAVGVGETQQFTAEGTYSDTSKKDLTLTANWTSSSSTVATVGLNTGLATGQGAGTAQITATDGLISGSATLQVDVNITSVAVEPGQATIEVDGVQQFTAEATFTDGSTQDVTAGATWTSSDDAIATIDNAGLATGVSAGGPVTITAEVQDPGTSQLYSDTSTLTVTGGGFVFVPPSTPTPLPAPFIPPFPVLPTAGELEDENLFTREEAAAVIEGLDPQDAANLIGQLSDEAAAAILAEVESEIAAALVEFLDTGTAADIFEASDAATAASVLEEVTTEKAAEITDALSRTKAADVLEQVTVEKAADILEEVDQSAAGEIVTEIDSPIAADILSEVQPRQAGAILNNIPTEKVTEIIEGSLLERLPQMSPQAQHRIPPGVVFRKLPTAPVEHLLGEIPPVVDPSLPAPVPFVQTGVTTYTIGQILRGAWGTIVGSPAPIERILARANEDRQDVRVVVRDLISTPNDIPDLPSGLILNEMFSVSLENVEPGDFSMAHVTTFVEQSWLEANNVHKWSVEFNRFDEDLNQWVPFPTKRVREDQQRISYTMVVPGFSTVAITGRPEQALPPQIFDVSGLSVFPPRPTTGDDIIVQARVRNTSNQTAVYPAHLWVDDIIDETRLIVVEAGQTAPIRFNKLRPEGQFKIRVDRLIGSLTVGTPPTPTPTPTDTPIPSTPTVGPSPTPGPTDTPTPPPTATPRPTSTPTPVPTREGPPPTPRPPTEAPTPSPTPRDTPRPTDTPLSVPTTPPTAEPPTPPPTAEPPTATPTGTPTATPPAVVEEPAGGFPTIVVILIVLVLLIGGGGAGYYFYTQRQSGPPAPDTA